MKSQKQTGTFIILLYIPIFKLFIKTRYEIDGEWAVEETKLLLDKYETYLSLVGPMKKFKTKKIMWDKISQDIKQILNIHRSAIQCENRYKTILKRKKKATDNNQQSGSSRKPIEYESELKKIAAIDDSIEPEILCGVGRIMSKESSVQSDSSREPTPVESGKTSTPEEHYTPKLKKSKTVSDTFIEIQKEKEENKERRHREKMEMMRALIESLKKD